MAMKGRRALLLGALLITTGLTPVIQAAVECPDVDAPCVGGPEEHDAGHAEVVDRDVSAEARGGVVAGTESVRFVADYLVDDQKLAAGEEIVFDAKLEVLDREGDVVARDHVDATLQSRGTLEGDLVAEVDTIAPLVEDGEVVVEAQASLLSPEGREELGFAKSVSPVGTILAPPSDLPERTHTARTVDVGDVSVGPDSAYANVTDGDLFVAPGTYVKLEVSGTLSTSAVDGVDDLHQQTSAEFWVRWEQGEHYASDYFAPGYYCEQDCSTSGKSWPVEFSITVFGDEEDYQNDLDMGVLADWDETYDTGDGSTHHHKEVSDSGENRLIAATPPNPSIPPPPSG